MERVCYTIPEFCEAHGGISKVFFHKMQKEGYGPRITKVGTRTLITVEAAAEWLKKMEAATDQVTK